MIHFVKMHGAGNDYVYINGFEQPVEDPVNLAREVSDRHRGIGSDGLILILPSKQAEIRMRMFNPDGSESEMCGNGIRCVAKYAYDHGLVTQTEIRVETGAGILPLKLFLNTAGRVERVQVSMGEPRMTRGEIPLAGPPEQQVLSKELLVDGECFHITCLSMGNPHCVIFVDDVESFPLERFGPLIENHHLFPQRTNVEIVQVLSRTEVKQRTWERGAGETLACGTGASAVAVACVLNYRTERKIVNHLRGGDLELEWLDDGPVLMTGPAEQVFEGTYNPY